MLFGDCRYYQSVMSDVAEVLGLDVLVFEEGYLRPHYITMERSGVNGFSQLSRDPNFYLSLPEEIVCEPEHAHNSKSKLVIYSIIYYALSNFFTYQYPHYEHHRGFSAIKEAFYGVRAAVRKFIYAFPESRLVSQDLRGNSLKNIILYLCRHIMIFKYCNIQIISP